MKLALSLITVPFAISFLDGIFMWYLADGFYMLMGFTMMAGLALSWYHELKN